mmetsp:Transcript_9882/g.60221  ORF Transcript_9882/g.60221 Transcript_9882/m.60221 type:complete len:609 (+) Transcript_9882:2447-4273(+)
MALVKHHPHDVHDLVHTATRFSHRGQSFVCDEAPSACVVVVVHVVPLHPFGGMATRVGRRFTPRSDLRCRAGRRSSRRVPPSFAIRTRTLPRRAPGRLLRVPRRIRDVRRTLRWAVQGASPTGRRDAARSRDTASRCARSSPQAHVARTRLARVRRASAGRLRASTTRNGRNVGSTARPRCRSDLAARCLAASRAAACLPRSDGDGETPRSCPRCATGRPGPARKPRRSVETREPRRARRGSTRPRPRDVHLRRSQTAIRPRRARGTPTREVRPPCPTRRRRRLRRLRLRRRACRSNRPPNVAAKHVRIQVAVHVRHGCAFVRAASARDVAWLRWRTAWTCFRACAPLPGPPAADSARMATPWTCRCFATDEERDDALAMRRRRTCVVRSNERGRCRVGHPAHILEETGTKPRRIVESTNCSIQKMHVCVCPCVEYVRITPWNLPAERLPRKKELDWRGGAEKWPTDSLPRSTWSGPCTIGAIRDAAPTRGPSRCNGSSTSSRSRRICIPDTSCAAWSTKSRCIPCETGESKAVPVPSLRPDTLLYKWNNPPLSSRLLANPEMPSPAPLPRAPCRIRRREASPIVPCSKCLVPPASVPPRPATCCSTS